jgi:hypothetical protein
MKVKKLLQCMIKRPRSIEKTVVILAVLFLFSVRVAASESEVQKNVETSPSASAAFLDAVAGLSVNEEGYIDSYKDYGLLDAGFRFNLGRDYLSPVPTTEIVLNPNLTQNPGW